MIQGLNLWNEYKQMTLWNSYGNKISKTNNIIRNTLMFTYEIIYILIMKSHYLYANYDGWNPYISFKLDAVFLFDFLPQNNE